DVRVKLTVRPGPPEPIAIIEQGADRIVDGHVGPQGQRVVDHPKPPEEEGLGLRVVVDDPSVVVVGDLRPGLPAPHLEPGTPLQRGPAAPPEYPGRFDPVGDGVPGTADADVIPASRAVDALLD